jgi:hypothetical protein
MHPCTLIGNKSLAEDDERSPLASSSPSSPNIETRERRKINSGRGQSILFSSPPPPSMENSSFPEKKRGEKIKIKKETRGASMNIAKKRVSEACWLAWAGFVLRGAHTLHVTR